MIRRSIRKQKAVVIFEPAGNDNPVKKRRPRKVIVADDFHCTWCRATRWCRTGKKPPKSGPYTTANDDGGIDVLCRSCTMKAKKKRRSLNDNVASTESRDERHGKAAHFARQLVEQLGLKDASLCEMLHCTYAKKNPCHCVDQYIGADIQSAVKIIRLHHQASVYSKLKYENTDPSRKKNRPGFGNGQKKSLKFAEFVIEQRTVLKNEWKLCERAVQKILCYSNNFLHKRLKTESNCRRLTRTKGLGARGLLRALTELAEVRCCPDHCSKMTKTHVNLTSRWRHEAALGQANARRVLAEMLMPSGGRTNCHQFISMVTGCAVATIERVRGSLTGRDDNRRQGNRGVSESEEESHRPQAVDRGTGTAREPLSDSEPELVIEDNSLNSDPSLVPDDRRTLATNVDLPVHRRIDSNSEYSGDSEKIQENSKDQNFLISNEDIHRRRILNSIVQWNEVSAFRPLKARDRDVPSLQGTFPVSENSRDMETQEPNLLESLGRQSAKNLSESYDLACQMDYNRSEWNSTKHSSIMDTENGLVCSTWTAVSRAQPNLLPKERRKRPQSQPKLTETNVVVSIEEKKTNQVRFEFSEPKAPKSRTRHVSLPSKPQHFHSGLPDVRSAIQPYHFPQNVVRPVILIPQRSLVQPLSHHLIFSPELPTFIPLSTDPDYLMSPDFQSGDGRPLLRPESTLDKEGIAISGRESDWSRFLDAGQ